MPASTYARACTLTPSLGRNDPFAAGGDPCAAPCGGGRGDTSIRAKQYVRGCSYLEAMALFPEPVVALHNPQVGGGRVQVACGDVLCNLARVCVCEYLAVCYK